MVRYEFEFDKVDDIQCILFVANIFVLYKRSFWLYILILNVLCPEIVRCKG